MRAWILVVRLLATRRSRGLLVETPQAVPVGVDLHVRPGLDHAPRQVRPLQLVGELHHDVPLRVRQLALNAPQVGHDLYVGRVDGTAVGTVALVRARGAGGDEGADGAELQGGRVDDRVGLRDTRRVPVGEVPDFVGDRSLGNRGSAGAGCERRGWRGEGGGEEGGDECEGLHGE